jgi:hypothetical protein
MKTTLALVLVLFSFQSKAHALGCHYFVSTRANGDQTIAWTEVSPKGQEVNYKAKYNFGNDHYELEGSVELRSRDFQGRIYKNGSIAAEGQGSVSAAEFYGGGTVVLYSGNVDDANWLGITIACGNYITPNGGDVPHR